MVVSCDMCVIADACDMCVIADEGVAITQLHYW